MAKPVEFAEFYNLLQAVKVGDEKKDEELAWMLAEYEHAKDAKSPYDELGQIFCHHGVMELYEYTGVDNIKFISGLEKQVWDYLEVRMGISLPKYMVGSMTTHANKHELAQKMSVKWETPVEELESNIEGLAQYVAEGIIELLD